MVVNKVLSYEMDVVVVMGSFNKYVLIIDNIRKDKVRMWGGFMLILICFILYIVFFVLFWLVCEKVLLCMLKIERGREYLFLSYMLYYYLCNCCWVKVIRCFVILLLIELLEWDVVLDFKFILNFCVILYLNCLSVCFVFGINNLFVFIMLIYIFMSSLV